MLKIKPIVLCAVSAFMTTATVAGWIWLKFIPDRESKEISLAYSFLPQKSKMAVYWQSDRFYWGKERAISDFVRSVKDETLRFWADETLTAPTFDWVGSVSVAAVNPTIESDFVLAIGIKDKIDFWRFKSALTIEDESIYETIKISKVPLARRIWYFSEIDNYLICAVNKRLLKEAIDDFKRNKSLADREIVKQDIIATDRPPVAVYIDRPNPSIESISITGNATSSGWEFEQVVRSKSDLQKADYNATPQSWQYIPDSSIVALGGFDLASFFDANAFQDSVAKEIKSLGIDLKKDIVANISKDFALVLLPDRSDVSWGYGLIFTPRDRDKVKQTFAKIDKLLEGKGWTVTQSERGSAWSQDFAEPKFYWGTIGSQFYFLAGGTRSHELLRSNRLITTNAVKKALTPFDRYSGFVFINPSHLLKAVKNLEIGAYINPDLEKVLSQIDNLVGIARPTTLGWRAKYWLRLKPQ